MMDDESLEFAKTNFLEAIIYNLNKGTFVIKDQKVFDEGVNKILDGIIRWEDFGIAQNKR